MSNLFNTPKDPLASLYDISAVIPVYNEENNLRFIFEELKKVFTDLDLSYEMIFIDDGSSDDSLNVLSDLHIKDERVKVIEFRRNFGQTAAFSAGFDHAQGNLVVTLDADGQNDPADIPVFLDKLKEGNYDLVVGWRMNRREPFLRRLLSNTANTIISRSTHIVIHDRGCSLKLFKSDLVKHIRLYGQLHRFLPELASMVGAKVVEVPTHDRKRVSGKSKYGSLSRTPRVVLDLVTVFFFLTFFTSPMRLFGSVALVSSLCGIIIGGYLTLAKIYYGLVGGWAGFHAYQIGNRPLLLLAILLLVIGVQFLMMGLLGEMIMRIYYESRGKPIYFIRNILE